MKLIYKITLSFILIIVLLAFANIYSTLFILKNLQEERLKSAEVLFAKSLANRLYRAIIEEKIHHITDILFDEKGLREEKIEYILVMDKKHYLLAHTYLGTFPKTLLVRHANFQKGEDFRLERIQNKELSVYDIAVPVYEGIKQVGDLHLGIKSSYVKNIITPTRTGKTLYLVTTILIALIAMFIAMLLSKTITNPTLKLKSLVEQIVEQISKGKIESRIEIKSHDEIGDLANAFNQMAEDLEISTVSKDYMDSIIRTIGNALIVLNPQGRIEKVNQATIQLIEYSEPELIGKPFAMFFVEENSAKSGGIPFESLIKNASLQNSERYIIAKSGTKIPVLFSSTPMYDSEGKVARIVCVTQDITELKEAELELHKAKNLLEIIVEERTKELREANEKLIIENVERIQAEKETQRDYDLQKVINAILRLSLEPISFDKLLGSTIEQILSVSWLTFESVGCIHLAEGDPQTLVIKAKRSWPKQLETKCASVPFGTCLCGRAALSQQIVFADRIDERHDITYDDIPPHGHYCVPILLAGKTLGVINIYLREGHQRKTKEEEFLKAIANTLAGIIARRRTEEALNKAKEDLERQNEELKALDKMKDGLIRDVSHELRTPVAKHNMQLEVLKRILARYGIFDECRKIIRTMESSLERQESVIRNILNLSRLEAGGRQYRLEPVQLDKVLKDVLEDYRPMIEANGIEVKTKLDNITINSDKEMLFHVFSNLINNAIKYRNPVNTPKISVFLEKSQSEVIIRVKDNGIGLLHDELQRAFDRFYQGSVSAEGSGVGLTISKMIVEGLEGRIWLESDDRHKGLTAFVALPLNAPKTSAH